MISIYFYFSRVAKGDLLSQLRGVQDKCKELERENSVLRAAPPPSPVSEVSSEKFAGLVERNKLLSEWREQLVIFSLSTFVDKSINQLFMSAKYSGYLNTGPD